MSNISIESLKIRWCRLPTETLSHLMQQINRCSALRFMDLSDTTLTGCLSGFLPDPHPGLPKLEELHLENTVLNKYDLTHLTQLMQTHKVYVSHFYLHSTDFTLYIIHFYKTLYCYHSCSRSRLLPDQGSGGDVPTIFGQTFPTSLKVKVKYKNNDFKIES